MEPADDELICRYRRSGDAGAFQLLFERHSGRVFSLARGMVGQPAAAEEILQETFMAVARNSAGYCPQGQFRAWLLRIARNLCLNAIESRKVRAVVDTCSDVLELARNAKAVDPLIYAENSERMSAVDAAIARLPERQREALLLYAMDGMQYLEIAHAMDVPVNTVKTLIHRARAALAEELGEENHGE